MDNFNRILIFFLNGTILNGQTLNGTKSSTAICPYKNSTIYHKNFDFKPMPKTLQRTTGKKITGELPALLASLLMLLFSSKSVSSLIAGTVSSWRLLPNSPATVADVAATNIATHTEIISNSNDKKSAAVNATGSDSIQWSITNLLKNMKETKGNF